MSIGAVETDKFYRHAARARRSTAYSAIVLAASLLGLACTVRAVQESAAPAQDLLDLSLEELVKVEIPEVYGASKRTQKTTEAPSSVSVVTAREIKQFGYKSLSDILSGVRGFYITKNRYYEFIGVRGFSRPGDYNARVLV